MVRVTDVMWAWATAVVLLALLPCAPCAPADKTPAPSKSTGFFSEVASKSTGFFSEVADSVGKVYNDSATMIAEEGVFDDPSGIVEESGLVTNSSECDRVDTKPDGQKICVKMERNWKWKCILSVGGCGAGGFLALSLTLPCFFLACGFGVIGVAAGSLAACFQARCGTPICFRIAQSVSMLGTPLLFRVGFGMLLGVPLGVAAGIMWVPYCFKEHDYPFIEGAPSF